MFLFRAYNNSQIEDICKECVKHCSEVSQEDLLYYIRKESPKIDKESLEKYKNEIEKLKPKAQAVLEKKFNYSVEQSFKKLCEIQDLALETDDKGNYCNLSAAIKAEELKGKMYGIYEADNKQKNIVIPVIKDDI